ncbi:thiamine pyrophosphate-dependent enzyme [Sphingomonas bacterium]|uniref:thiamine pyrophosphate-dependent enzyme n=1 Tax=Sphingomonas bacterium TaxID=1895847 RepID=UPI0020C5D163|nr:thiamine pyrophosphate-dependent enzyme [Sphingomonas bacterium]
MIGAAAQAPGVFHQAIAAAYGLRGVAHINIPPDVFAAKVGTATPSIPTLRPRPEVAPASEDIAAAAALIAGAGTIALFCGAGARGAEAELVALSERLKAPLMHTYRAQDLLAYTHPSWIGGVGLIGGRAGVDAVRDADLLLMLGTDYPYVDFLPKHGNVIQVDERALAIGRRTRVGLGIVGSVKPTLRMLLDRLAQKDDGAFLAETQDKRTTWDTMLDAKADPSRSTGIIHPQAVARAISDAAADDAIVVTDTGEVTLWAANWLRQTGRQRITGSFNNAAVGTGLGLAIGAQSLDRDRQVVAHIGDGGFTMLAGEFMTAVEHKLPVKIVVYDNSRWGLVHLEMEGAGLPATGGSSFPNMDFAAFARACGAAGFTARDPATLSATVREFLASPGPAILHAIVDPDELPAMAHIEPGQAIGFGIAKVKEAFAVLRG